VTNVRLKVSTMVPTPTLTASASNSAIKASDNPDNCWRLSAQNHAASAPSALRWPSDSRRSRIEGRISAAPSSKAASTANPEISESPYHRMKAAAANTASATALCNTSQRCCACCQA
jgi:hypothetical protein